MILDIFSRYVVGWMVASRESAALAEVLIRQTCAKQGIDRDQLTIHADRGSSMTSKPVALRLADLGVIQSHSRPHVSNDNPLREAQFTTLKYRPDFPGRFDSIEDARRHCQDFFGWYNNEHRHTGLVLQTPADVHYGLAEAIRDNRAGMLDAAYTAHPERFVRKPPEPPKIPETSWINRPEQPGEETRQISRNRASFRLTGSADRHLRAQASASTQISGDVVCVSGHLYHWSDRGRAGEQEGSIASESGGRCSPRRICQVGPYYPATQCFGPSGAVRSRFSWHLSRR